MRNDTDLFVAGVLKRDMNLPATTSIEPQAGRHSLSKRKHWLGYRVADVRVEMESAAGGPPLGIPEALEAFAGVGGPGEIAVTVGWRDEIAAPRGRPVFDSGGVWRLYRTGAGHEFVFRSPATGAAPYKLAVMDEDFRRGQVWLSRRVFGGRREVYPLEYPLDELLVIHRLARGEGVEVHACGVLDGRGRGLLFTGHSGAGKSTMARLWQKHGRGQILSDDRIILRRDETGAITMHGTPWHGEARLALPISAPLCGVFVLEHGRMGNELDGLSPARAAAELMARSFLPFHDAAGLEFSLQFFSGVVEEIRAKTFRFVPDESAVREVERNG